MAQPGPTPGLGRPSPVPRGQWRSFASGLWNEAWSRVEIIRQRFVERGLEQTLARKKPDGPSAKKLLDGEQEAKIIAVRLGPPPEGSGSWSLRLVSRRVVELHIVESISHETVRRVLKKTV